MQSIQGFPREPGIPGSPGIPSIRGILAAALPGRSPVANPRGPSPGS